MIQSLVSMGLDKKNSGGNGQGDSDTGSDTESTSDYSVCSINMAAGPAAAISSVATDSRVPLVIKVDDVSLATFCVMLYYIYTDKIDLTVDTSRFVLSDTNKADLLWRDETGKVENSAKWRPLDQDSPWRLKDITWNELKDAAVQYGLKDLQTLVEQNLTIFILADNVTVGDKYDFDVVLSTDQEVLRTSAVPTPVPKPAPATKTVTEKEKSLISSLLKDPTSVDICFTFASDKTCSNIGLWAHRFVLSRHESFVKLIKDATTVQSLGGMALAEKAPEGDVDSDAESISNRSINTVVTTTALSRGPMVGTASKELVIRIDMMLYYMYTGEIDRTVEPSRFVLSDTNKASLVWRDSTGKVEDSVDWRPLDQDSPWRLKDVTWNELKDAAVHFGLEELQDIAEDALGINRI
ncbi:hypothetical protein BGX24_007760 [Mortierella sp. AD032]|nr:hypothetical protein BGX24_007760 [Mortierella sp. AD032]